MTYVAIKMDIVHSRRVRARAALQERLLQAVEAVNRHFTGILAADATVTHGDEVQAMVLGKKAPSSITLCEHLIDQMVPPEVRFGLGLGGLSTRTQPVAAGMDGPAWHRAQQAMAGAQRGRKRFVFQGDGRPDDTELTAIVDFLLSHRMQWTTHQREAVQLLQDLGSQQAVAQRLQVSEAAVSKRLSACMWRKYEALRTVAEGRLEAYGER